VEVENLPDLLTGNASSTSTSSASDGPNVRYSLNDRPAIPLQLHGQSLQSEAIRARTFSDHQVDTDPSPPCSTDLPMHSERAVIPLAIPSATEYVHIPHPSPLQGTQLHDDHRETLTNSLSMSVSSNVTSSTSPSLPDLAPLSLPSRPSSSDPVEVDTYPCSHHHGDGDGLEDSEPTTSSQRDQDRIAQLGAEHAAATASLAAAQEQRRTLENTLVNVLRHENELLDRQIAAQNARRVHLETLLEGMSRQLDTAAGVRQLLRLVTLIERTLALHYAAASDVERDTSYETLSLLEDVQCGASVEEIDTNTLEEIIAPTPFNSMCPICLDPFDENIMIRRLLLCSHLFHPACLVRWLSMKKWCPVCRTHLFPPTPEGDHEDGESGVSLLL